MIEEENKSIEFSAIMHQQFPSSEADQLYNSFKKEFGEKFIEPSDVSYARDEFGRGSYGMVKLASIISMNHKHVAAKISYTGKGNYVIEEARNMVRLDDPNITKIFGVTMLYPTSENTLDVVVLLELADSDFSSIIKPSSSPLTIHNIKRFCIQIASALQYLHNEKKMRHLDLKPGNILFFKNKMFVNDNDIFFFKSKNEGTLKLTDFGSIVETENEAMIEKNVIFGTKMYLPPEHDAAKDNNIPIPVSFSFDIFGFGVILMEMLVWNEENRKKKFEEMKKKKEALKKGEVKLLESNESCVEDSLWREEATNDENGKKLIEICKKCLKINPLERYHDGGQLLNALEELAEDEEDLKRKEEQTEILMRFQRSLIDQMTSAIEVIKSASSTSSSSNRRPTNMNNFDSSVETATAARREMTITVQNKTVKNGDNDG